VLGDLLGSLGRCLAALAIRWFGWLWADPVLSMLVALLILNSAWRLLRLSAHILLEGVPDGMDSAEVEAVASWCRRLDPRHPSSARVAAGFRFAHGHLACRAE
jgi:Co/Zn/Cd efflux system component